MHVYFKFIGMIVALNFMFIEAQPTATGDCFVIEREGAYGMKDYIACSKETLDVLKEKAKVVEPQLMEEWQKKAIEWRTKYKEDYPYPKPEKVKLKIVESKLSLMEAEKKALEWTKTAQETYAVVKIMNENGTLYEVMTENESVTEYLREMKFYVKEWQRYYEKQKKRRPTKPSVRIVKNDFKTPEEAQEEIRKLMETE